MRLTVLSVATAQGAATANGKRVGSGSEAIYGTRTLTYDAQDRLTSVILGDVKTTFEYDYLGRRTTKTVYDSDGNGGWMTTPRQTRTFAYDGWNVMAEYLTDAEHSTATLARTYAWGTEKGS